MLNGESVGASEATSHTRTFSLENVEQLEALSVSLFPLGNNGTENSERVCCMVKVCMLVNLGPKKNKAN